MQTGKIFPLTTSQIVFMDMRNVFLLTLTFFSELYLEELSDVIVATDIQCQTDAFLDRPATPLFIPAKTGKDVETQIEEGEVGNLYRNIVNCMEGNTLFYLFKALLKGNSTGELLKRSISVETAVKCS